MASKRLPNICYLIPIVFFLLCVNIVQGEDQYVKETTIKNISPVEAKKLVHDDGEIVIVDVRTARERYRAAIPDSVHIEMTDVFRGKYNLQQDTPVLLYCAVGGRSYAAAKWLKKKGFKQIYNLDGGIEAWQKKGLDVVQGETQ